MSNVSQVMDAALALPDDGRIEIIEARIASLDEQVSPPFSDSWRAIVARRSAEIRSGAVKTVPWEEIKAKSRNAGA